MADINNIMNSAMGQSALNAGSDLVSSLINNIWADARATKQYQRSIDMWNMQNEYDKPVAQMDRLKDAGLNPLFFGLDGNSSNAMAAPVQAASPSFTNPIAAGLEAYNKRQLQDAQIENIDAQTTKIKEETNEQTLINEFLEKTMDFRVKGEELKNELDNEQINKIRKEQDKIAEEIKLIINQTDSEAAKKLLYEAETTLRNTEAWRIVEMLPYEQALAEAKTEHEKAAAALAWTQEAYQNQFVGEDYVNLMFDEMKSRIAKNNAEASETEQQTAIKELENAVRKGEPNDLAKWFNKHPWAKAAFPPIAFLSGDVFKVASDIEQSCGRIVGPVLGLAAGGAAAGAAGKGAAAAAGRGRGVSAGR